MDDREEMLNMLIYPLLLSEVMHGVVHVCTALIFRKKQIL